ncbi:MAG TPA: acetyl-CoA carboxylase carboxyltransferase subunit beta [Candidatus Dormibacteraeota bacterium]|nr:acetyl-CoA carboxylase carboxyltransferase subunit beta [Candidatus Dormibacteraeota bacterium]
MRPAKPCPACGDCHLPAAIADALQCCPGCGHHHRIGARERIRQLLDPPHGSGSAGAPDDGGLEEWDRELRPRDPLEFVDLTPYRDRVVEAQTRTGLHDALITGRGTIESRPVGVAVMDFGFIGGSMGEVVGERVARAMERSAAHAIPFIAVAASGGARMQEGLLSLMQMAKTSIARTRLAEVPVPYITVLTNPTMGGVMASFAATADVVIAEPGATVGFAGARVITQATHEALPEGFQTSEFMLDNGFVDRVVPRAELRAAIGRLLTVYPLPAAMQVGRRQA